MCWITVEYCSFAIYAVSAFHVLTVSDSQECGNFHHGDTSHVLCASRAYIWLDGSLQNLPLQKPPRCFTFLADKVIEVCCGGLKLSHHGEC